MFSDPSGLAPEKENRTMAPGNDLIGGSITQGYWNETTQRVFMGEYNDSPLGPRTGTRKYEDMSVLNWVEASGSSGGGTSGASLSNRGGGNSGSGKSSRRLNNDKSLNRKSHQQQDAVRVNMRSEPELQRLDNLMSQLQIDFNKDRIDELNEQLVDDFISKPLSFIGFYASYREYNSVYDNMWQGSNGTWYSLSKKGNGERSIAKANARYFKRIGRFAAIASIALSLTQMQNASIEGEDVGTYVDDLIMTGVGFWGWPGFATSFIYFNAKYSQDYGSNPTDPFVRISTRTNTIYYKK